MNQTRSQIIQVIETRSAQGRGVNGDPVREVVRYFSLEGELLAESDPLRCVNPADKCDSERADMQNHIRMLELAVVEARQSANKVIDPNAANT